MKPDDSSLKEQYKHLNLIFVILLLGIVILLGASVFIKLTINYKFTGIDQSLYKTFKILLGISIIIFLPLGFFIHKRKVGKFDSKTELSRRLAQFKTSYIIKLLVIELLCIFNLVIFFLFSDYYLLIPVSVLLLIMLINRPTIGNISNELKLTNEEKEKIIG
jgi:ABC-type bacteriocin/lantibiotic exporter with double-glycine peptidase domain